MTNNLLAAVEKAKSFMMKERRYKAFDISFIKGTIGIILALIVIIVFCACKAFWIGLLFLPFFIITGFFSYKKCSKKDAFFINGIWAFVAVIATILVSHTSVGIIITKNAILVSHLFNILCVITFCTFIYILLPKFKAACFIGLTPLMVLGTANGFILQFRGNELGPFDFFSLGTAASVANGYVFRVPVIMALGWAFWLLVMFTSFSLPDFPTFVDKRVKPRLYAGIAFIIFVITIVLGTSDIKVQSYNRNGTSFNGYYLNFVLKIRDSYVEKPKNYSLQAIKELEDEYAPYINESYDNNKAEDVFVQSSDNQSVVTEQPDIIVIVNESFADFSIFGEDTLRTNIPLTPFIDSLSENTVKGYALSSVFGGNTANSGFEFLTGHSMIFLPSGSVPYQQYIDKSLYSIAHYLKDLGYTTYSTHPYKNTGWSRNTVFPLLGFSAENIDFIDAYPQEKMVRSYVGDIEVYEKILDKLENKSNDTPMFIYSITMQNHGPYEYDGENYEKNVELIGYKNEYPQAEQYLSAITHSDTAIKYLIEQLENREKDTVVLFFGDHFPKVEDEFFEELHGGDFNTLSEQMLKYQVPFFIWANYEIEERTLEHCTSLNYLSGYLLDIAGLEKDVFHHFLNDLEESIPAINAFGYYSKTEGMFIPRENAKNDELAWINKYHKLQYNDMFENSNNRSDLFFDNHIMHDE